MLQNTYTTDDLVERLGLMRKFYNKRLFTENENVTLQEVVESDCDEHTLNALEYWVTTFSKENIQPLVIFEALDTVQEDLGGVPSVLLYVPVRFTHEQIEGFGKWFRENVQPNILLSIRIDPRSTGGCSFVWGNRYYDFSLKYFIDKQRENIVTMFNKYSHAK
jgi:F0F1-type ATP synthase delta subunit